MEVKRERGERGRADNQHGREGDYLACERISSVRKLCEKGIVT